MGWGGGGGSHLPWYYFRAVVLDMSRARDQAPSLASITIGTKILIPAPSVATTLENSRNLETSSPFELEISSGLSLIQSALPLGSTERKLRLL